jgi:hypothetical protein
MAAGDPTQIKLEIGANVIQTGDGYDWRLTQITNDTFMVADVQIGAYANRDGGYIKKRRFEPREPVMYIQSKLRSKEQIDATWLQLTSYMNCKRDAILTRYKHGVVRSLLGTLIDVKKRDEEGMKWNVPADIRVVFSAPDPWYESEEITRAFTSEIPLIYGPLTMMAEGFTGGLISSGNEITFDVEGDDPPPFLLKITATGAVVNPKITNAHGQYIKAKKTLATGDVLTVFTGAKPYLRCNGAWCSRDAASEFFELDIGSNTISISADSGIGNMTSPQINYKERYQ